MVSDPLSRLAIRQMDEPRLSSVGHSRLPRIHHDFGLGDSLGVYIDQRLPPISTLLRDVPPPPTQHQHYPSFPPSPLPSPVGPSPSLFSAPYPSWSTLPPWAQSASGHYPGFLPPSPALGPRRASTDCISKGSNTTPRSYSVPTRTPFHHHRASPDRDRQRRSTKDYARLHRSSSSDFNPDHHSNTPTSHAPTSPSGKYKTRTRSVATLAATAAPPPPPPQPPTRKPKPTTTTTTTTTTTAITTKREWYKMYRGVAYRTRQVKCRKARFPLMERFPEELVDERNDWVRPGHRAEARVLAENRRRQREEWLAARAARPHQRVEVRF